jgi:hypothetical protein
MGRKARRKEKIEKKKGIYGITSDKLLAPCEIIYEEEQKHIKGYQIVLICTIGILLCILLYLIYANPIILMIAIFSGLIISSIVYFAIKKTKRDYKITECNNIIKWDKGEPFTPQPVPKGSFSIRDLFSKGGNYTPSAPKLPSKR